MKVQYEQEILGPEEKPAEEVNTYALAMTQGQLQAQYLMARQFPRSVGKSMDEVKKEATLTAEIAESCRYVVPMDGKTIEGPSIRYADILAWTYGNLAVSSRVVGHTGRSVT